jgi:hypothetical protein
MTAREDGESIQNLKSKFEKIQSSIQSTLHENHSILDSNDLFKFTSYVSRNKEFRNVPSRFKVAVPPMNPTELTEQKLLQFIGIIPLSKKTDIPGEVLQTIHPVTSVCKIDKPNRILLEEPEVLAALDTGYPKTHKVCCIPNTDQFYLSGNNSTIRHMNTAMNDTVEDHHQVSEISSRSDGHQEGNLVYSEHQKT